MANLANASVSDGLPIVISMTAASAAARLAGTFTSPATVALKSGRVCQDSDTGDLYALRSLPGTAPSDWDRLSTRPYVYTQSIPSSVWTVVHNLGKNPSVTVTDTANDVCFGDVHYDSTSQLTIRFSAPFAGVAYLT